uniref:Uncharacterized protein n=1 Tax=Cannabis sativa TaxID=3483 RepID=A0A803QD53_CANSA
MGPAPCAKSLHTDGSRLFCGGEGKKSEKWIDYCKYLRDDYKGHISHKADASVRPKRCPMIGCEKLKGYLTSQQMAPIISCIVENARRKNCACPIAAVLSSQKTRTQHA